MHRQIHHRIKSAREDSGRTAAWMAKKIGVHRNTYRDIENGLVDLRVSQLKIISEITARPVSWFVYGRDGVESIQAKHEEDVGKQPGGVQNRISLSKGVAMSVPASVHT